MSLTKQRGIPRVATVHINKPLWTVDWKLFPNKDINGAMKDPLWIATRIKRLAESLDRIFSNREHKVYYTVDGQKRQKMMPHLGVYLVNAYQLNHALNNLRPPADLPKPVVVYGRQLIAIYFAYRNHNTGFRAGKKYVYDEPLPTIPPELDELLIETLLIDVHPYDEGRESA